MKISRILLLIGLFCNPLGIALKLYTCHANWWLYINIIGCVILGYALKDRDY
jgi:hypothetical protein